MKTMKKIWNIKGKASSFYIKAGTIALTVLAMCSSALASENAFASVVMPVVDLLKSLLTPMLAVVGAAGALYCVLLGVKYAKASEPQDREKAKASLKNAIIGFVLIFVLILALDLLMPVMIKWVNDNNGNATDILVP